MSLVDKFVQNRILGKTERKTKRTFAFVFFGPLITSLILFIVGQAGTDLGNHSWLNWIIVIVMVPAIYMSLFLTQKLDLIGNYGESILLLIPTFVWLLPASEVATAFMVNTSFILIMTGLLLLFLGIMSKVILPNGNEEALQKIMPVFIRIAFTFVSVVSTIIVSIILINWAKHSMEWHLDSDQDGTTFINYTTPKWITFISVVTLFTALGLVSLGLVASFQESFRRQNSAGARETFRKFITKYRNENGVVQKKFVTKKKVNLKDDLTNTIEIQSTIKKSTTKKNGKVK